MTGESPTLGRRVLAGKSGVMVWKYRNSHISARAALIVTLSLWNCYGLERLVMFIQGVDNVYDLD